jgi:hypothetical protein
MWLDLLDLSGGDAPQLANAVGETTALELLESLELTGVGGDDRLPAAPGWDPRRSQ